MSYVEISKTSYIAAASHFAAHNDVMYYLNGIYIEPADAGVFILATDGHAALIIHDEDAKVNGNFEPFIFRLSENKWTPLRKVATLDKQLAINLEDNLVSSVGSGARHEITLIDGQYPDLRRIVPTLDDDTGPVYTGYSTHLLERLNKGAKCLMPRSKMPAVSMAASNKSGPTMVTFSGAPEAIALVMPARTDPVKLPDFLNHKPEAQAA